MPHLNLKLKKNISNFRKIAIGTWHEPGDPSVYGTMEFVMDQCMDYIREFREATGKRLTVTHLVAKAMAETLRQTPDVNAILRFNRIYLRERIGVFLQVAMEDETTGKADLSGVTIYDMEQKDMLQIIQEVEQKVNAVRQHRDPALEKSRGMFQYIPYGLVNSVLKLTSFLSYTLNLDLKWAGLPDDPFGSVMVTNIGSLGLDVAYVPIVPFSRVPILLATGAVKEKPVVENGEVVIRQVMKVNATFDHRFIDGFHAAVMSQILHAWLADPYKYFGPIPPLVLRTPGEKKKRARCPR